MGFTMNTDKINLNNLVGKVMDDISKIKFQVHLFIHSFIHLFVHSFIP